MGNFRESGMLFYQRSLQFLKFNRHTLGVRKFTRFTKDNFTGGLFLVYRALAGLEIPEDLPESFATAFSAQTQSAGELLFVVSSSST